MSIGIGLPLAGSALSGRVTKHRRMLGHYVEEGKPVVDIQVGIHIVTLCAPEAGKIIRLKDVGQLVGPGEQVAEITGVGTPTWELFIAHRWVDAPGHAGRVSDRLIADFGPGQVFRDIESVPLGADFVKTVRDMLQRAVVIVVIIGPRWLTVSDEAGNRRIDDPADLHREEIRTALDRRIRIIPVLVDGARMPPEQDLPEDIRPLVRHRAVDISETRLDYDVGQLSEAVARALAESPKRKAFLAQVPTDPGQGFQWITDNPEPT